MSQIYWFTLIKSTECQILNIAVRPCSCVLCQSARGLLGTARASEKYHRERASAQEMGGSGQVAAEEKNRWIWLGLILHASVYICMCVYTVSTFTGLRVYCAASPHPARSRASTKVFLCAPGQPAGRRYIWREMHLLYIYCVCINSACAREVEHWLTGFQHLLAGAAWLHGAGHEHNTLAFDCTRLSL